METGFCLGSNMGDRLAALKRARDAMLERGGAKLAAQSPIYETEPVGVRPEYRDKPFLNAVVIIESDLPAGEWLHIAQGVERRLGRIRTDDRTAPRTVDIDILYHGSDYLESGILIVPHPRWAERRFVVQPLADVRPDLVLPESSYSVRDVLAALPPGEQVTRLLEADAW